MSDDEDDFADRDDGADEDPREALGYNARARLAAAPPAAPAPSLPVEPKPTPDRDRLYFCAAGDRCKGYKAGAILHQPPGGNGARTWCAGCVGSVNRQRVDDVTIAIRALKAAAAGGDTGAEHAATKQLEYLVGDLQAGETGRAIRESLSEKPQRGRR